MPEVKAIKIDKERCIGCGSCASFAPGAFVINPEEGKAELAKGWEEADYNDLLRARDSCPTQAISLELKEN